MKEMNASDFKAHCLAVLDDVAATREPVRILKRGRPVAVLVPPLPLDERAPQATLAGVVVAHASASIGVRPARTKKSSSSWMSAGRTPPLSGLVKSVPVSTRTPTSCIRPVIATCESSTAARRKAARCVPA